VADSHLDCSIYNCYENTEYQTTDIAGNAIIEEKVICGTANG
jgi:hypothetical protein